MVLTNSIYNGIYWGINVSSADISILTIQNNEIYGFNEMFNENNVGDYGHGIKIYSNGADYTFIRNNILYNNGVGIYSRESMISDYIIENNMYIYKHNLFIEPCKKWNKTIQQFKIVTTIQTNH